MREGVGLKVRKQGPQRRRRDPENGLSDRVRKAGALTSKCVFHEISVKSELSNICPGWSE